MPRGAKLTPEVEELISRVCIEHPDWIYKPIKIQQEVIRRLPESLKVWGGPNWPGRDVIQDRLRKKIRPNLENRTPEVKQLDEPWSLGASVEHGIPPEATKDLFDIWRFSLAMDSPISIRQAKWIAYIRNLPYQFISTGDAYSVKVNRNLRLIRQSLEYSILERASLIMGKNFDSTSLDSALFMPSWERSTALELGKVSFIDYPQEALAKVEKQGTSPTSMLVKSVEQAIWFRVRAEQPPDHLMDLGVNDKVLPEEDDLVAAYWLTHLSKGPLWNNLPEQPDRKARLEYYRQERKRLSEAVGPILDYGGFPADSLYSRQCSVRERVLDWVEAKRDYYPAVIQSQKGIAFVFNAMLLKTVGYEVTPEDMELWFELRKQQLKAQHKGYNQLPPDIQQRFIHDEQTFDDKEALESADYQVVLEQKQLEQEFIELVQHQGGTPVGKTRKEQKIFWESIRDEWIERYPSYDKSEIWRFHPERLEDEYTRLIKKRNLNNKSSDSIKGGTT